MKKKSAAILSSIALIVILIGLFNFKSCRINSKEWKYGDGYHLGDLINIKLKGDTIFMDNIASAILLEYNYRIIDDQITITSLDRKNKGLYFSK